VPELLALLPRADLYLQDEVQFAFHPTLTRLWCLKGRRGQRLVEAPGDNRHPSLVLGWWTGVMGGLMAGSPPFRTADVFCDQVRAAVARSKARGRVAVIIADNLKTHTAPGSLLVRSMLTELEEHLSLIYTPADDPDANRIEWRCAHLATGRDTSSSPPRFRAPARRCGAPFSGTGPDSS
jgi:hypothetical protein